MAECDNCKDNVATLKYVKEKSKWICETCYYGNPQISQAPMRAKTFEPFDLYDGPIHERISHDDPNFIKDTYSGGFRSGVHIETKADRDKYYKMLGIREAETGDSFQGVRMELKTKPAKRIYSFGKKSLS